MGRKITHVSNQRVPVSPEIVRKLRNNVAAAYYYTQLLYYSKYESKDSSGWFDKNSREIEEDIALGRRQQEYSRELLRGRGWIESVSIRGGTNPTTRFRVIVDQTGAV